MQDLLNEEEFLVEEYNPWKHFMLFAITAVALNIAMLLIVKYKFVDSKIVTYIAFISVFLLAPIFSVVAALLSKQMREITKSVRGYGVALIYLGSYVGVATPAIIVYFLNKVNVNLFMVLVIALEIQMISCSITATIINLIAKYIFKRKK